MDLKAIREQITANLNHFDPNEKKIIILQLLNFLQELDTENGKLKVDFEEVQEEMETLRNLQVDEEKLRAQIDLIIDRANEEADKLKVKAEKQGELHLLEVKEQGRKYMVEFLDRLRGVVLELQKLDEEAKAYRMHILTVFKKTLFKFSNSEFHLLKFDDSDMKELFQFYKQDMVLQQLSDQIMDKLNGFENYLQLSGDSNGKTVDPREIKHYLQNVHVEVGPEIEDLKLDEKVDVEPQPQKVVSKPVKEPKPRIETIEPKQVAEEPQKETIAVKEQVTEEPKVQPTPEPKKMVIEEVKEEKQKEDEQATYAKFLDIFNQYNKK